MLKITNLNKSLGNKTVLKDCQLEVKNGSIFGLIGPNGAGKSTLLRCIADVYQPETGEITFNEQIIRANPKVKNEILLLSDDPYYLFNASLKDMKEYYRVFYPQLNDETYDKYLKLFNLDENKSMNNHSKGMKRQSFILLALAIAPKLLLLDESFDGLDPLMRLMFKRAINECVETKDMTIIISSHNLRELEDICDSFGILSDAHIKTSGAIESTKENVHKVQVAFLEEKQRSDFSGLNILSYSQSSRVITMVVKGEITAVEAYIKSKNPLMVDILNVSLEEIFLSEMEVKEENNHA